VIANVTVSSTPYSPLTPRTPQSIDSTTNERIEPAALSSNSTAPVTPDTPRAANAVDSAAAASSAQASFLSFYSCFSCQDDIDITSLHFSCEGNPAHGGDADRNDDALLLHGLCLPCFELYISSCCDHFAADQSFPIKCPCCRVVLPESAIKIVLSHNAALLTRYDTCSYESGLMDLSLGGKETPLTCRSCNSFTAILPSNYAEWGRQLQARWIDASAELKRLKTVHREGRLERQREVVKSHGMSAVLAELLEMSRRRDAAVAAAHDPNSVQDNNQQGRLGPHFSYNLDADFRESEKRRLELEQSIEAEQERQVALTHPAFFFHCEAATMSNDSAGHANGVACHAHMCLCCSAWMDSDEAMRAHICHERRFGQIYNHLLELLSTNALMICPHCNFRGRKDNACCHITCSKCSTSWCYVCGRSLASLNERTFANHNLWKLSSNDDMLCPMYLQYMYGDRLPPPLPTNGIGGDDDRFNGDADAALERFHIDRQKRAVAAYVDTLSPADQLVYQQVLALNFPTGIWDAQHEFIIERNAAIRASRKLPPAAPSNTVILGSSAPVAPPLVSAPIPPTPPPQQLPPAPPSGRGFFHVPPPPTHAADDSVSGIVVSPSSSPSAVFESPAAPPAPPLSSPSAPTTHNNPPAPAAAPRRNGHQRLEPLDDRPTPQFLMESIFAVVSQRRQRGPVMVGR